jgi:invasion protein IalB
MRAGIVFAPARSARRMATCVAAAATLALGTAVALAQPTPPAPAAPKAQPKPVQQKAPAKQPQQPAQQQPAPQPQQVPTQQQAGGQQELPPIVYSPWTKFCGKDAAADAKEACLTMKEARLETGQFLAGAALIEQQGQEKKVVRITVPLTMQIPPGTRVQVDKEQGISGRYIVCMPNGCISDHEVDAAFVAKLKKGQQILLQSANISGQTISIPIPLADFAKANEGPATDPKKFEEDQKKLQDELQKKAEEARKRLQASPPQK